jgi:DEAD/DEAH box helicase domain-containing protein
LYDYVAGGIGLAPRLFEEREALVRRTRRLIESCACEHGCPACIGPDAGLATVPGGASPPPTPPPQAELLPPRKKLALAILDALGVTAVH